MRSYKKNVEKESKSVPKIGCCVHGCPLRGTTTKCTLPDEFSSWYCRFHLNSEYNDFYVVTEVLKKYITILEFAYKIKISTPYEVKAFYRSFKDKVFEKTEEENQWQYSTRLNSIVVGEVKAACRR